MCLSFLDTVLADHILRKPDISIWINVGANADAVQRLAEKMYAMPARRRLIDHRLLDLCCPFPGSGEGTGVADVFAAICIPGKSLCGDAITLLHPIRAGMAEAAMVHIPAMQACASRKRSVPLKRIEAAGCPIAVNLREQLLR